MNRKKEVKINFTGFWGDIDVEDNFFINTLKEEFEPVISNKPDYLFYSVFSDDYLSYSNDVIRIFYTGECQTPDFNLTDYALGFDYIDFADRYQRFPNYFLYDDILDKAEIRGGMINSPVFRDKFCSFVCSNKEGNPIRQEFFNKLNKIRRVDSGGKLFNNVGGPVKNKISFEERHRFSICFENSLYPGYTTEKIVQAFAAGTIPIYWGDPLIGKVFNTKAFIYVNDFDSIDKVIERVMEIENDSEKYKAMLKEQPFLQENLLDTQIKEAKEFILDIFRKPKNQAFRRNRTFWGKRHENRIKGISIGPVKICRNH